MKVLKIGVFAMALGFFAASCSNGTSNKSADNATADTTQMAPAATATDSNMAAPAMKTDSTAMKADTAAKK